MFRPLVIAFLAVALATGIPLAVITPPGQVADEPAHVARTSGLLLGEIVGHRETILGPFGKPVMTGGVSAEPALMAIAALLRHDEPMDSRTFHEARAIDWFGQPVFLGIGAIASYLPIFYVPAALALGAARLVGCSPFVAFLVGRVVNLICFALAGAAALHISRRGRALMFCVLTCPMTLSLAASFNEDGLLIATATLAAALLSRGAEGDRVLVAAMIAAVAAVKPPYLALAGVILTPLPALREWTSFRGAMMRRIGVIALLALPGLLWTAWMLVSVTTPTPRLAYAPGPLWPGDPARMFEATDARAQLGVFHAAPSLLLTLPWSYFSRDASLPPAMVGILGWLNILLPDALYTLWYVAAGFAVLADLPRGGDAPVAGRDSVLCVLAVVVAAWGIALIQYLTWTNVGADHIEGVQGRYLLPLIPFLAVAIPRARIPRGRVVAAVCLIVPLVAAAAGAFVLPQVIVAADYVH